MAKRNQRRRRTQRFRSTLKKPAAKPTAPRIVHKRTSRGLGGFTAAKKRKSIMDRKQVYFWLFALLVLAFFLRVYFNVEPATEDEFLMTGGSDPYYHKRVVDFVVEEHEHLEFDKLLNYPKGGENPRPPLFDWSMAVLGLIFAPLFGGDVATSTWWAVQLLPAIMGTLTVVPVYYIGKETFNEKAGLYGAFLFAIMAGTIGHSTLGLADHDSFAMFFAVLTFYYYLRSLSTLRQGRFVDNWGNANNIKHGIIECTRANYVSLGYALMAGLSLTAMALSWKGYAFVPMIIGVNFFVQMVLNSFRKQDNTAIAMTTLLTLATPLILSAPYYFTVVSPLDWWLPPFYILIAAVVISIFFVPTRDLPWVISVPALIITLGSALGFLLVISPETGQSIFGGMGYFLRTKLFDTISEAQRPDFSRVVFSYGITTFFLALFIALPVQAYEGLKSASRPVMFLVVWMGVGTYMSYSAVRFIFNATPIYAIMAGWTIYAIMDWIDYKQMIRDFKSLFSSASPRTTRIKTLYRNTNIRHMLGIVFILFMVVLPNAKGAIDASIPYEEKRDYEESYYDLLDSNFLTRWLMLPDKDDYDPHGADEDSNKLWYLGAFGPSFVSEYWRTYFDWLGDQDTNLKPEDRPAFVSWWDYGFWCIEMADHPSVADNFQNGYQVTGSFIAAQGEDEGIAIFVHRILEGCYLGSKSDFTPEVSAIVHRYFNDENYTRLTDNYNYDKFQKLGNSSVTPINAKLRVATRIFNENLDLDELVEMYGALRAVTGFDIRYVAIDYRLFPFTPTNNIFYAPITLADHQVDEYLEIIYITDRGRFTAAELEKEIDRFPDTRVTDTDLKYKPEFFDTMLYHTYVGWSGHDVNLSQSDAEESIPSISGELESSYQNPVMPAWMLRHFRMVYQTMFWSPYPQEQAGDHPDAWIPMDAMEAQGRLDKYGGSLQSGLTQGVTSIKYYDGAWVNGTLKTDGGAPIPNAHVTMYDEFGIPHDRVVTGSDGRYSLLAPFGEVIVAASMGDFGEKSEYLYQQGPIPLETIRFNVSDAQAMRVHDWEINKDIIVESSILHGKVYWDLNMDDSYQSGYDEFMVGAEVELKNIHADNSYTAVIEEDGEYSFDDVPPGEYELNVTYAGHTMTKMRYEGEDAFQPDTGTEKKDIGIRQTVASGFVYHVNGTWMKGSVIRLHDKETGTNHTTEVMDDGQYVFYKLMPSTYTLYLDHEHHADNATDELRTFDLEEGLEHMQNLTIYQAETFTGRTYYDNVQLGNITVVFSAGNQEIYREVESDEEGNFTVKLPYGRYEVHATYKKEILKEGGKYGIRGAYYDSLTVDNQLRSPLDVNLVEAALLRGHVYDDRNENGIYDFQYLEGIHGAEVGIVDVSTDRLLIKVESDEDGIFDVLVPRGEYKISARDPGDERIGTGVAVVDETGFVELPNVDIKIGNSSTLSGVVMFDGFVGDDVDIGDGVPNALITLTSETESFSTYSDLMGKYFLSVLPAHYDITVETAGYLIHHDVMDVPPGMADRDFRLDPEEIHVSGIVWFDENGNGNRESDEGVKDLVLDMTGDYGNFKIVTGEDGTYSVNLNAGPYEVYAHKDVENIQFAAESSLTANIGEGALQVDFQVIEKVFITGKVWENGVASQAEIQFRNEAGVTESIETGENGRFVHYIAPGKYLVGIDHDSKDYRMMRDLSKSIDLGDIEINDFVHVSGRVYQDTNKNSDDETDEGIREADMEISNENGAFSVESSGTGRFSVYIKQGEYDISVDAQGYEPQTFHRTFSKDKSDHNFNMKSLGVTLYGAVWADYDDNDARGDDENLQHLRINITTPADETIVLYSNASGEYSVILDPGEYEIETIFYSENRTVKYYKKSTLILEADSDSKVENIKLVPTYLFEGVVYENSKGPLNNLDGASIKLLNMGGAEKEKFTTDEDGYFDNYIEGGEYTLYVTYTEGDDIAFSNLSFLDISGPLNLSIRTRTAAAVEGLISATGKEDGVNIGRIDFTALVEDRELKVRSDTNMSGYYRVTLPLGIYRADGELVDENSEPAYRYLIAQNITVHPDHAILPLDMEAQRLLMYGLEWDFAETEFYASRDFYYPLNITLTNTGNDLEVVELEYFKQGSLQDTRWDLAFSDDTTQLDAGETKIIQLDIRPRDSVALGNSLEIIVNATVQEMDSIHLTKKLEVTAVQSKTPDLSVSSVEIEGDEIVKGGIIRVKATIVNDKQYSRADNFTVKFILSDSDGDFIDDFVEHDLELDQLDQRDVRWEYPADRKGNLSIEVIVDGEDLIHENDEDNNRNNVEFRVKSAGGGDDDDGGADWSRIFYILVGLIVLVFMGMLIFSARGKAWRRRRKRRKKQRA